MCRVHSATATASSPAVRGPILPLHPRHSHIATVKCNQMAMQGRSLQRLATATTCCAELQRRLVQANNAWLIDS